MTSLVQSVAATFAPVVLLTNQSRDERHELCRRVAVRESPAIRRVSPSVRSQRDFSKLQVTAREKVMQLLSREVLRQVRQSVPVRLEFQRVIVLQNSLTSANQSQPGDRR